MKISNATTFDKMVNNLTKKNVCIDCGANVGKFTEIMAATGATVYAFEPNPFAFDVLHKRFLKNKNVIAYNKGVWDKNTNTELFFHENSDQDEVMWSTGSSILEFKGNVLKNKSVIIELVDLVEFINKIDKQISILKIDIEGAECEVLESMIRTETYKKIDAIFVETHDHKIPELKEKTDRIRDLIKKNKISNIDLNWI